MTRLFEHPLAYSTTTPSTTRPHRLMMRAVQSSAPSAGAGLLTIPSPDVSSPGADVDEIVTGTVITSEWGTSVAADLAELWSEKATVVALEAHLIDPVGAHAATAVSFVPTGALTATDVQAALEQAAAAVGPPGTPIIPVAYADWPPANPVPNTLYLRLAP